MPRAAGGGYPRSARDSVVRARSFEWCEPRAVMGEAVSSESGILMQRHLEPEWLDELPPDDPGAIQTRRDLRRIHSWMGNVGIVARQLRRTAGGKEKLCIADVGAGDGTFMLRVAQCVAGDLKNATLLLVDRQAIVSTETRRAFKSLGWRVEMVQADVFDWLASPQPATVVTATLFLHHFSDGRLVELFDRFARSAVSFIACEPRRCAFALAASRLLRLIGCNRVARHDAVASVRAGFRGHELSSLWSDGSKWTLKEDSAGLFSHIFVAQRHNE